MHAMLQFFSVASKPAAPAIRIDADQGARMPAAGRSRQIRIAVPKYRNRLKERSK
jgi:hypothetical protein